MSEIKLSDNKIYIDFNLAKNSKESDVFDIKLTSDEESVISNLDHFEKIEAYYTINGSDSFYNGECFIKGICYLKDARDISKVIKYPFENDVDFQIQLDDLDNSDLLPENDGNFDIRTVILALIYDAIPSFYTESELSSSDDSINYFTEDEFDKNKW